MQSRAVPGIDRPYLIAEFHDPERSAGRIALAVDGLKAQGHKWVPFAEEAHHRTGISVLVMALPGHQTEEDYEHSTGLQFIVWILTALHQIYRTKPREVQLWGFSAGAAVMAVVAGIFRSPPTLLFLAAPPFRPRLTPDVGRMYGYRRKLNSLSAIQVLLGAGVASLWGVLGFIEIYASGLFNSVSPFLQQRWFREATLAAFVFGCFGYIVSERTRRDVQRAFGKLLQEFVSVFQLLALFVVGGAAIVGFATAYLPDLRLKFEPFVTNPWFKLGGITAIVILTATFLAIRFRKKTGLRARFPFESTSKDTGDFPIREYPYYPFVTGRTALSLPTLFLSARVLFGIVKLRGIPTVIALGDRDEVIDNEAVYVAASPSDRRVLTAWLRLNRETHSVHVRKFGGIPHSVMNHPDFGSYFLDAVVQAQNPQHDNTPSPAIQTA